MLTHITPTQKVLLLVPPEHKVIVDKTIKSSTINNDNIIYAPTKSNDTWARDFGPITTIENTTVKILDFQFVMLQHHFTF